MSRLPVAAIETRQFHIRAPHSRCRQRGVLIEERGAGSRQASLELQWTPADSTQEHEFYRKRAIGFMAKRALAAHGRTLRWRVASAMGPDRRRRDAGDALSSPRSGEHRDGPLPAATRRAHGGCSMPRRASSPMKEHRLLGAPAFYPHAPCARPLRVLPRAARVRP